MIKQFRPAIVILAFLTLITGAVYPLAMLGLAQLIFPHQANGSLIRQRGSRAFGGQTRGSEVIGQSFTHPKYF